MTPKQTIEVLEASGGTVVDAMPAREKQDYQDDEPNNQRQSGERYCEHNKIAADRHWIQQATEVEAKNYAWMN